MSELIFQASVDAIGRLRFDAPELTAAELSKLAGKRVTVKIVREVSRPSAAQYRLLFGQVYSEAVANGGDLRRVFIDDNGVQTIGPPVFMDRHDVHNFGKVNLIARPTLTTRGTLNLLGSTTEFTPAEFNEYIERLCATLANLGVFIPPVGT